MRIETTIAKAFRTFLRVYSFFRSEGLNTNIKLILHRALIRSILPVHRLQNKVLHTISNFPRNTPASELHVTFNIPYIYDFMTRLCREQADVIRNHKNAYIRDIVTGEAARRKCEKLKLGGGQAYTRSGVQATVLT
jgi:hypothetical protein